MFNAWTVYLLSASVLLFVLYLVSRKWISTSIQLWSLLALGVFLVTPVGVANTNDLAPAWLAIAFELVFGSSEVALASTKPLIFMFLLSFLAIAVVLLFRLRSKNKQKK